MLEQLKSFSTYIISPKFKILLNYYHYKQNISVKQVGVVGDYLHIFQVEKNETKIDSVMCHSFNTKTEVSLS